MDVHNLLGPGWDEWDYHQAMIKGLESRGHSVRSHQRKHLTHREIPADRFELDLLVDDLIVLELKHIKEDFHPSNFTQLINYLKCWGLRLGILINFGQAQLKYKRVPFSEADVEIELVGRWMELPLYEKELIERAVSELLSEVGYGYGVDAFRNLLKIELGHNGVRDTVLNTGPSYGDMEFEERAVNAIALGSKCLVTVSACSSSTDLSYLKTYMKQAARPYGILINLDNSKVQLRGVV